MIRFSKNASFFSKGVLLVGLVFSLSGCGSPEAPSKETVQNQLGNLPLSFQENKGQVDEVVKYLVKNGSTTIFFTPDEVVYNMVERVKKDKDVTERKGPNAVRDEEEIKSFVIRQSFVNANKTPSISSSEKQEGTVNYMIGNDPSKWVKGASTFGKIRYEKLYEGIDLEYSGEKSALKYAFIVSPGSDYQQISVKLSGIDSLMVDGEGNLVMKNGFGNVLLEKPYTFQEVNGKQKEVESSYKITSQDTYTFEVGEYDDSLPLIIDPRFVWASYWGRAGTDEIYGIDIDDSGNVYVTGRTTSTAWTCSPACTGFDNSYNGSTDVFVTKFNSTATSPVAYFTYLGSANADNVNDIAVNSLGQAYVAGTAGTGYPFVAGSYDVSQTTSDSFVSRLSADGTQLLASTYFGGTGTDVINDIAIDDDDSVYVAGSTGSTESTGFPIVSAYDGTHNGGTDGFYVKFNTALSSVSISSFIGGTGNDTVWGIDVDSSNRIYLGGESTSTDYPFVSAYQAVDTAGTDAFISRISSGGSSLQYSSFLGAAGSDTGLDIATTDAGGVAALVGGTTSASFNIKNAYDSSLGGSIDGFVALFDTSSSGASSLIFSTYLGGSSNENIRSVDMDSDENVYVFGETSSSDFPLTIDTAVQTNFGSVAPDFYLSKFNNTGDELLFSTYVSRTSFGGNGTDTGWDLVVNDQGRAYGAGSTTSTGLSTTGVVQTNRSTGTDGYFFQISTVNEAPLEPIIGSPTNGSTIFNTTPTLVAQFRDLDVNEAGTVDFRIAGSAGNCLSGTSLVDSGTSTEVTNNQYGKFTLSISLAHGQTYHWCARNEDDEGLQSNSNAFTTMGSFTIDSDDDHFLLGGYIGGSTGATEPVAVGLDTSGNVVMVGQTESTDFPTVNPIQASPNVVGQNSIFVTKFNPALSSVIVSTYLQGNFEDYVRGGGVDASGNVYVTGISYSTTTFTDHPPVNAGFDMTPDSSTGDIYLVKFNEAVDTILYATYLGGSDYEDQYWTSTHIAPGGIAYIVGQTFSTNFRLKNEIDSTGDSNNGDAFVAKIDTNLSGENSLIYSTYVGGAGDDDYEEAWGVDADNDGNAYVVGYVFSPGFTSIAITSGAFDETPDVTDGDGYLLKFDPDGDLLYGTYIGGTGADVGYSVVSGPLSTVYLCGATHATDLVTTPGAYDTTHNGGPNDGFVYRMVLNGNGSSDLLYGTYIGGTGNDWCGYSAVNSLGSFFFQGHGTSGFPTTAGAFSSTLNGTEDQVVVKLHPGKNGSSDLVYASYFGGNSTEEDQGVHLDGIDFYMVGQTSSFDFPTASGVLYSAKPSSSSSTSSGYLTKFEFELPPNNAPTAPTNLFVGNTTAQAGSTNPNNITDTTPAFSAICNDSNGGDILAKYRIQVDNNNDFSSPVWDNGASGTTMLGGCVEGDRSQDIHFGGTPLALDGTTYYWRIKFWDLSNAEGVYSSTNTFTMGEGYDEFSTYLGGSLDDLTYGIGLDPSGNIVVMGSTYSSDFPTENGLQGSFGGLQDAFVVKMSADGSDVLITTYFGASDHDPLRAGRIDASGNVYLFGATLSSDLFTVHSPTLSGFDMTINGDVDTYLVKLNPSLNSVLYGTYLGGSGNEEISWKNLRVDNSGMAYVAGWTSSTNLTLTANAFDSTGDATNRDGFVAKINTTVSGASSLVYSSYIGGSGEDKTWGVSYDSAGNIYVAGESYSSDFSATTSGAFKESLDDVNGDGFVLKIDPTGTSGTSLVYGTAIGGDDNYDGVYDVVPLASGNNVYVCGGAYSSDLATTSGAFDQTRSGDGSTGDIFLYELSLDGNGSNDLVYGTYAGGAGDEWCGELNLGSMIFYGSAHDGFPTTGDAYQSNAAGDYDLIVGRLDPAGNGSSDLIYASYFGGSLDEFDYGTSFDSANNVLYMSGSTASTDFPVSDGYFSTTNLGQLDGFGFSMTIPEGGGGAAVPDAITDLDATAGNAQVSLTWSAPANNGSAITDYIVEYGVTSGFPGNAQVFNDGVSASTGATVTSLSNGTNYSFRVKAVNGVGQSAYSNVDTATPSSGPTGPINVGGTDYYVVTSTDPTEDTGNEVCAKVGRSCVGYTNFTNDVCLAVHPSASVISNNGSGDKSGVYCDGAPQGGICNSLLNTCTVCPACGVGVSCSDPIGGLYREMYVECGALIASEPDAVTDLSAVAGNAQVTLTWSAPGNNGSAITDYVVEYGVTSGFPGNAQVFNDGVSASTGATVTGLVNGTEYSFRVAAVNGIGQGPYSNVDTAIPAVGAAPQSTAESEISVDVNDFLSFEIENFAAGDEPAGDQPFGAGTQITDLTSTGSNDYAISGAFGTPIFTRLRTTTNSNDGYNVIAYASNAGGRTNTLLRTGGAAGNAADEITDSLPRLAASQGANDSLTASTDTGLAFRLHNASTSAILREADEDTQWGDDDTTNALWASFPLGSGAAQIIYDTATYSATATTAYINWFVGISSTQRSGSYSGQVTFTASVN